MQNCADLLSSLQQRGVQLWAECGRLHFNAPKGTLSSDDLHSLRERKHEVMALLEQGELVRGPRRLPHPSSAVPLTALQLRKWRDIVAMKAGRNERTCMVAQRTRGPLNVTALWNSLRAVGRRHDALRIKFAVVDGVPQQMVDCDRNCDVQLVDLIDSGKSADHEHVAALCEQFVREKVELCSGPLFAAKLFRLSDCDHVFVIAMDHMISDAVSCEIVARETWAVYHAEVQGLLPTLPALPLQFLDYVAWQHRTHSAWLAKHGDFWRNRLAGVPPSIPRDRDLDPPASEMRTITFDPELSARLREIARRERSLLAVVVLTIYAAAVARWRGRQDFLLAFISNARDRPELQTMVGFLADYLHLRIEVRDQDNFVELLRRLDFEFRSAYEHQDYGRVPDLMPSCSADVGFNWVANTVAPQPDDAARQIETPLAVQPFPLQLAFPLPRPRKVTAMVRDTESELVATVVYRPDVFTSHEIEQFGHELMALAEDVSRRPHIRALSS